MILVTGASGKYGTKAIEHLLNKGVSPSHIIGMVRAGTKGQPLRDKGIELRVADYADKRALASAFKGVEKLLLVSSSDRNIDNRTAHHRNAIAAAKAAGVAYIVYTSFIRKPGFENSPNSSFHHSHVQTEQSIKDSGIAYTILQNGIYQEMIPIFAGAKVAETGLITFPAGEGRASWVLREELAEAAAHVLTTAGHENKIYPLTNEEAIPFGEIAGTLTAKLGKTVKYQSPPVEEFEATLRGFGVPEVYIGLFTTWGLAQARGELDIINPTLTTLLGRKPTTVVRFIERTYS